MAKSVKKTEQPPLTIIDQALQAYDPIAAGLQHLRDQYGAIAIKDVNDSEGMELAKSAVKHLTTTRTSLEAKRKELKADSLEYGRRVDAKAKEILTELLKIENPIREEITRIEQEKERIKRAEETRRIQLLTDAGFNLIGQTYQVGRVGEFFDKIMEQDEVWLQSFLEAGRAERDRLEEERRVQQETDQRLQKEREELEALRQELAQKEAALRAKEKPVQHPGVLPFEGYAAEPPVINVQQPQRFQGTGTEQVIMPNKISIGTGSAVVVPTPATASLKSAYFRDGWEACKTRIIKVFTEGEPRNRAAWVELFKTLQP